MADELTLGVRAFQRGRFAEAFERLAPFAEAGELRAQQILARLYYAGNGVEKDPERYRYWLQRAAENGCKPARAQLKKLDRE